MIEASREQVFAQVQLIRQRAMQLLAGEPVTAEAELSALLGPIDLRLGQLARRFHLSQLAIEAIVCLLAVEYDPSLRTLIRAHQREAGRPCLELGTLVDLLGLPIERVPELERELAPAVSLGAWTLVERDETTSSSPAVFQKVRLAARVARYLVGDDTLLDAGMTRLESAAADEELPAARAALLDRAWRAAQHGPVVVEIVGKPNTGRRELACVLAHRMGQPLIALDLRGVDPRTLERRLTDLRREARLSDAVPALLHWDAEFPQSPQTTTDEPTSAPQASAPRQLPAVIVRFFETLEGVAVLIAEETEPLVGFHAPAVVTVEVPFPSPAERAGLFAAALARRGTSASSDDELEAILRRYALDPPHIEVAARTAAEEARAREPDAATVPHALVVAACRQQVKHDLKSLAERVEKGHKWEDLVIPVEVYYALKEMTAYIKHAGRVYEEWGFAGAHNLSRGVSALFSGPPGTGKTMCASVMARELDMELFRVDLSRVVSKWIGETEKNLAKVFREAQHSNAIILFDEADSLFAKRTEVKSSVDRYANLEVNYLLQRMEGFGGVTILTTNFEDTIDTAFKRRLTFRMRFEKPDVEARAALWSKVFPKSCAVGEDFDPQKLAELYEMSGGNIRSAALRAAFLAADQGTAVEMKLCLQAAERESQEMGLLTRGLGRRPPTAEPAADPETGPERKSPQLPEGSTARLVEITHPRNR